MMLTIVGFPIVVLILGWYLGTITCGCIQCSHCRVDTICWWRWFVLVVGEENTPCRGRLFGCLEGSVVQRKLQFVNVVQIFHCECLEIVVVVQATHKGNLLEQGPSLMQDHIDDTVFI